MLRGRALGLWDNGKRFAAEIGGTALSDLQGGLCLAGFLIGDGVAEDNDEPIRAAAASEAINRGVVDSPPMERPEMCG